MPAVKDTAHACCPASASFPQLIGWLTWSPSHTANPVTLIPHREAPSTVLRLLCPRGWGGVGWGGICRDRWSDRWVAWGVWQPCTSLSEMSRSSHYHVFLGIFYLLSNSPPVSLMLSLSPYVPLLISSLLFLSSTPYSMVLEQIRSCQPAHKSLCSHQQGGLSLVTLSGISDSHWLFSVGVSCFRGWIGRLGVRLAGRLPGRGVRLPEEEFVQDRVDCLWTLHHHHVTALLDDF